VRSIDAVYEIFSKYLIKKEYDNAEKILRQELKSTSSQRSNGDLAFFYSLLGTLMTIKKNYKGALIYYQKAETKQPSPHIRLKVARTLANYLFDYQGALAKLRSVKVHRVSHYWQDVNSLKGICFLKLGFLGKASKYFKAAIEIDWKKVQSVRGLSFELFDHLITSEPYRPEFKEYLEKAYLRAKKEGDEQYIKMIKELMINFNKHFHPACY